jgi:hypothetical protein
MADQGFCDSYSDYRALHPGKARLARRMAAHALFAVLTVLEAGGRRISGDSRWHLDLARFFYHRNRIRYDSRLLREEKWRQFALRDNWLTPAAEGSDVAR